MFEQILNKKLEINFRKDSNCYTFEIPNFLSDDQYNLLEQNFPKVGLDEAKALNGLFNDADSERHRSAWIQEMNEEAFLKYIYKNEVLNEFVKTVKNPIFTNLLIKEFYTKILKSRIYDPKNLLKLFFRKSRAQKKRNYFFEKFIFNEIYTELSWAYLFNGAETWPHTDGKKKILSLLLYFPDKDLSNNQIENLGVTFFNAEGVNDRREFLNNGQKCNLKSKSYSYTLPFKKKSLFGFIRSHKSWHAIEKVNVNENFIRKSININLLLV